MYTHALQKVTRPFHDCFLYPRESRNSHHFLFQSTNKEWLCFAINPYILEHKLWQCFLNTFSENLSISLSPSITHIATSCLAAIAAASQLSARSFASVIDSCNRLYYRNPCTVFLLIYRIPYIYRTPFHIYCTSALYYTLPFYRTPFASTVFLISTVSHPSHLPYLSPLASLLCSCQFHLHSCDILL